MSEELLKRALKFVEDNQFIREEREYNVCSECGIEDFRAFSNPTGTKIIYTHRGGCAIAHLIKDIKEEIDGTS